MGLRTSIVSCWIAMACTGVAYAQGQNYAGTHFDLFRIENGKIAEHWDSAAKDPSALHFDPNSQNRP